MSIIDYDIKTKKILVYTPLDRSIVSSIKLLNIVNTFIEGIPNIKYKYKNVHCLILAESKYISSIILRVWYSMARYQMHAYMTKEYSHYMSDNGYCYFYSNGYSYAGSYPYSDDNTIRLHSKNLKMLWD